MSQQREIRQPAGIEFRRDRIGQLGFAGAVVGEREQSHHGAARPLLADAGEKGLERAGVGGAREQLIAVDQIEQCHRLPAQRVDDVPVVDDLRPLVVIRRAAASQRRDLARAEQADQPVVVETHGEPMADQPRRHRVEHPAQDEAARRGDDHALLLEVGGAALGQLLEHAPLDLDLPAVPRVAAADHLVDEAAVGVEIGEVSAAAQQQVVLDHLLQVPVRAFDRAVLVGDARIVARRCHPVVRTQRLVALGLIHFSVTVEVAERRRQTVGSVLLGNATQRPQRILQAFGKRHETLAAEHHMRMREAGEREAEVIEPMRQGHA